MFNRHSILVAIKHGIIGFIVFLSIIIIAKFLNHLIFSGEKLVIDSGDILLSFLGFFYVVFVRTVEEFSHLKSNKLENRG